MPLTSRELQRLSLDQYEYVTATFLAADTGLALRYKHLTPSLPDQVRYVVVSADRACQVYEDLTGTRTAWTQGSIVLRCSAANARVRLLLFVETA